MQSLVQQDIYPEMIGHTASLPSFGDFGYAPRLDLLCGLLSISTQPARVLQKGSVMLDAEISRCAPEVPPALMNALVRAESAGRLLAIGMDAGGGSVPQPSTLAEAVAAAEALATAGRTFSVGLAQIHVSNVKRYGLSWTQAFDGCTNLAAGQRVLAHFLRRAGDAGYGSASILRAALRGYNSGSVHATAADSYASRVLRYMAGAMPVSSAAFPQPAAPRFKREPGESLDIFEKAADSPGF